MRKWNIAIMIFILLIVGCTPMLLRGTRYQYYYILTDPKSEGMKWEDENILIAFYISKTSVNFTLQNKSDDPIKVIWDDASIVMYGEALRTMHAGVKYADRNSSQPSTTIPPKASIEDLLIPTSKVYYEEGYYSTYYSRPGGWKEHDLFPTWDMGKPEYGEQILGKKGQKFSVYLPIESHGSPIPYTFEFTIVGVTPIQAQRGEEELQ